MRCLVGAFCLTALVACGAAPKQPTSAADPAKEEQGSNHDGAGARAARGAVGGAAVGAAGCLGLIPMGLFSGPLGLIMVPVAIACVPVGIVAGATVGSVAAAATTPGKPNSSDSPPLPSAIVGSRAHKRIGRVEAGDVLPAGELYVAMSSLARLPDDQVTGVLLVNLDGAVVGGEKSYTAYVAANCVRRTLSVRYAVTFDGTDGEGAAITRALRGLEVERPGTVLGAALDEMCAAGLWWTNGD